MKTLRATRYVRPLNPRNSEHLVLGSDGNHYSVQFEVPWGGEPSILNAIGSRLCQVAGIETAFTSVLWIDRDVLDFRPAGTLVFPNGNYLGMRYPIDPVSTALYDFLPDAALRRVTNRADFWRLLPIDMWLGNQRASKLLFYRSPPQSPSFISVIVFRTSTGSIPRARAHTFASELPTLSLSYYGGSGGSATAESTAANLLEMSSSNLEELLDDLGDVPSEVRNSTVGSVTQRLIAARCSVFRDFSLRLRELECRVDACETGQRHPGAEISRTQVAGGFDHKLSATA